MLDDVDLGASLDGAAYDAAQKELYPRLARAQRHAFEAGLPVLVIVDGWNYSGKARTTQFLTQPIDPRGFKVLTWMPPDRGDRGLFPAQRFVERTPRRGELVFWIRSWYTQELERRVAHVPPKHHRLRWGGIRDMEEALVRDGTLVVKLWMHLDRDELARRRREDPHDPQWSPVVDDRQDKRYRRYRKLLERMLGATHSELAPWKILSATDLRHARVAAAEHLAERIESAVAERAAHPRPEPRPATVQGTASPRLAAVDLTKTVTDEEYEARNDDLQERLALAQYQDVVAGRRAVIVFEGWDAAGKGGVIRRLRAKLNPCYYDVHSIAAPDADEARHHYLWRFWRRLPPAGNWGVFDRSWYGRVLVERVEGFATAAEWQRAYDEIRRFEDQVVDGGAVLIKFWLHTSPEEQLRRFEERKAQDHKRHKITDDDWRNRDKRPAYLEAVEEMVARTDQPHAPWILVSAEQKKHARLVVLDQVLRAIARGHAPQS